MYKYQVKRNIPCYRLETVNGEKVRVSDPPIVQVEGVYPSLESAQAAVDSLKSGEQQVQGTSYTINNL